MPSLLTSVVDVNCFVKSGMSRICLLMSGMLPGFYLSNEMASLSL